MTFKEAKKILKKEGYELEKVGGPFIPSIAFTAYESPEICEAMQVVCSAGYSISMVSSRFIERKACLKKEYEKSTKAPGPGEEQPVEKSSSVPHTGLVYDQNFEVERLRQENKDLLKKMKEGNPALRESASQFNDALLDELRKKIAAYKKLHFYDTKTLKRKDEIIEELRDKNAELLGMVERMKEDVKDIDTNLNSANKTNKCLNKKVVELTKIKGDLNSWISGLYFCIHHNNDNYKYKLKRLGKEIAKLNSIIHDKNAVLSDVAEELRLSKIREKNLAELGLKYVGENEKLKKELADKVVDKIDAQALKSAESALAWKEKTITYKDMALAYYEKNIAEKDEVIAELREKLKSINMNRHNERICKKQLAEKDEVIADLGNELAATKKELEEKTKLVEAVRKSSKEDRDYGIAAEKMIQKMAKEIVNDSPVPSKDYKQYRLWANGYRFYPQLPDFSKEEEKKLEHAKKIRVSSDNAEEGADLYGVIVLCGKDYIDALKNVKDVWQE